MGWWLLAIGTVVWFCWRERGMAAVALPSITSNGSTAGTPGLASTDSYYNGKSIVSDGGKL